MEIIKNAEDFKKLRVIAEVAGSALLKNEGSEEFEACRWIANELIGNMIAKAEKEDSGNERN